MTFSSHPIFCLILVLNIFTGIGSFAYLLSYLRRVYTMTWVDLGEPDISPPKPANPENLFKWIISSQNAWLFVFSNQYKAVQDRRLNFLVWLVRGSCALSFLFTIIVFAY